MNKKQVLVGIAFAGVAVTAVAYWWVSAQQDSAQAQELVLYGNVDIREVRVAFNGSEHVSEVLVEEGDRVRPGQTLARLHTERLQAAWERARAEVEAVRAEAHAAELSYKRIKSLAAKNLASTEQADEAEAQSRAAAARVSAAEAVLAEAEQALQDAQLLAPVSGIVRDRIAEPGDFVTPQTPVLILARTQPVWVRTYLPETYLGKVHPGDRAYITTDSYPDKVYQAWVGFISPTAEFTPKNVETPELRTRLVYQMRVFACNPDDELRLGMPATVHIALGQKAGQAASPDTRCPSVNSANNEH